MYLCENISTKEHIRRRTGANPLAREKYNEAMNKDLINEIVLIQGYSSIYRSQWELLPSMIR